MKECPKNNQIKVSKKNDIVSIEKIVGSVIELSTKRLFLIGQVPVKKRLQTVFALQHIGNRKDF